MWWKLIWAKFEKWFTHHCCNHTCCLRKMMSLQKLKPQQWMWVLSCTYKYLPCNHDKWWKVTFGLKNSFPQALSQSRQVSGCSLLHSSLNVTCQSISHNCNIQPQKTKKLEKTKKSRTSEEMMGGQSEEATKKVSFDWMRTGPDYFSHFVFSVNARKHCFQSNWRILLSHVQLNQRSILLHWTTLFLWRSWAPFTCVWEQFMQ